MIKDKDFIEIDYTAKLKDSNQVFDTTNKTIAKKSNIYNKNTIYKPLIICVGERQVPPGLDASFKDKKDTDSYQITLPPEKAFGKKDAKLLQLLSQSSFRKQNITPYVGLQMNIDGNMGIVRTVTPGRVIVDFNHPLAGKDLHYDVKILRKITDSKEKLDSLLSLFAPNSKAELKSQEALIQTNLSDQVKETLKKKIATLIPSIKKITIKKE